MLKHLDRFSKIIKDAEDLPKRTKTNVNEILDIEGQYFSNNRQTNKRLADHIAEYLGDFEFVSLEKKLVRKLDDLGKEVLLIIKKMEEEYIRTGEINTTRYTRMLFDTISRLRIADFDLEHDFQRMAARASQRFDIPYDTLYLYFKGKINRISSSLTEENKRIIDDLSKITSSLINEFKEAIEKKVGEQTVEILSNPTGKYYITKETAHRLGIACQEEYHYLSPDEYNKIKQAKNIKMKSFAGPANSTTTKELIPPLLELNIYTDENGQYITQKDAVLLGMASEEEQSYHQLTAAEYEKLTATVSVNTIPLSKQAQKANPKEKDDSPRPVIMLYISEDNDIYSEAPMTTTGIDMTRPRLPLKPSDLVDILCTAEICFIKFNARGELMLMPDPELSSFLEKFLAETCTITETKNENSIHRYEISYVLKDGSLATSILV